MSDRQQEGRQKKKVIIIVVILLMLLIAIVAVIVLISKYNSAIQELERQQMQQSTSSNVTILNRGFVTEEEGKEIVDNMENKVADGMFQCIMTTTWSFADGESASPNAYVENAPANKYTFYFDVYLADTDEKVYSSPLVPVGASVKNIKFDKDLDAGEYSMRVQYTMVDEEYAEVSTVGFMITAIIRK